MFRNLRITILLYILIIAAGTTYLSKKRSTDWQETLGVVVHPINGDGSDSTQRYINKLEDRHFEAVQKFFETEGERFGLGLETPFEVFLGEALTEAPPTRPNSRMGSAVISWSLRFRYFDWRQAGNSSAHINLYVVYYDPDTYPKLGHSTGLQKGMIGLINAFASRKYTKSNNFIIAHELMHTVGAGDKYDFSTNQPLYPMGYADPDQDPLYPQRRAEIMGGRIPLDPDDSKIPPSLKRVVVGETTAQEINWLPS